LSALSGFFNLIELNTLIYREGYDCNENQFSHFSKFTAIHRVRSLGATGRKK
jgi:hypothetical protein